MNRTGQVEHGMMASGTRKISFSLWRYSHYFQLESKGKASTSVSLVKIPFYGEQQQQQHLLKHLDKRHGSTKLAAKVANAASDRESQQRAHTHSTQAAAVGVRKTDPHPGTTKQ